MGRLATSGSELLVRGKLGEMRWKRKVCRPAEESARLA